MKLWVNLATNTYTGYFKGPDLNRPGRDPLRYERAVSQAMLVAWFAPPVVLCLITWIPALVLGARIEPDPYFRLIPGYGIWWFIHYDLLATYRDPHLHDYVAAVFNVTLAVCALAAGAIIWAAIRTYWYWIRRAVGLPNEHGGNHWILPEELANPADPKDNLLPDDYDIHRGYGKKSRRTGDYLVDQTKELRIRRALENHESLPNSVGKK
jgi:hypothetical protein